MSLDHKDLLEMRTKSARHELRKALRNSAMLRAGFTNQADFEEWELLEDLRKTNLAIRAEKNKKDGGYAPGGVTVSSNDALIVDTARRLRMYGENGK